MAPFVEHRHQPPAGYLTPEEPSVVLVDSPQETRRTIVNGTDAMADQQTPRRKKSHSPSGQTLKRDNATSNSGLRFMVVEHPDQLKDKTQMRKNRIHVMHNYLAKEAQNPDSKDSRVQGNSKLNGKRKQPRRETPPTEPVTTTLNNNAPSNIFRQDISRLTPAESINSTSSRETPDRDNIPAASKSMKTGSSSRRQDIGAPADIWHSPSEVDKRGPLVKGIGGYFENSRSMRAAIEDIPFAFKSNNPGSHLTGALEPFGAWPSFNDPALDVYELKWKCSQRFGSTSLSMHWIPTILRARHAFLSTLCISSAHDDIMARSFLPPQLQNGDSLEKRWKVRSGVIGMINESLSDPEMRIADETIIAVLHVLNSEIMGCNDASMRVHQEGLHAMVKERGGLDKLGAGGQLAFVLTITNYMIATVRESTPRREYIEFASRHNTKIPQDILRLPESPIYNKPQGYQSINDTLQPIGINPMLQLLDSLRIMTNKFYIENSGRPQNNSSPFQTTQPWENPDETVSSLYGKVFAVRPAGEQDFNSMGERYMFEAVRLASLIYAHALANKIPFSKAATQVRSSSAPNKEQEEPEPMPIQIKRALMRTDVSYCWDHLAGVLFWVTLIAGAAANPGPLANEDRVGVDEDARKWITAISVRCCIVLSFEFGQSVLETLKRLHAIERVLGQSDTSSEGIAPDVDTTVNNETREATFGPVQPPPVQRGFADFAEEFLSI